MHPAIIVCIVVAVLSTILAIVVGIKENDGTAFLMIFFIGTVCIAGAMGFGLICSSVTWNEVHLKISPDKVETFVFQNNGIVAIAYDGVLYQSEEIEDLNAVNNIDYYELVIEYNAYNSITHKRLYPVGKGKIDDYIKEK